MLERDFGVMRRSTGVVGKNQKPVGKGGWCVPVYGVMLGNDSLGVSGAKCLSKVYTLLRRLHSSRS
jgi:hypothetical protein